MSIEKHILPGDTIVFKQKNPCQVKIRSSKLLSSKESPDEIYHIVLDYVNKDFRFIEGQSIGVLPKGLDDKGKTHKLRLYSIASSRHSDDGQSGSLSICVKRVVYKDEVNNKIIRGVASNSICDWDIGDQVEITGPTGKAFVLPKDPGTDLILLATGTGIAPFRAFLQYIYRDRTDWSGRVLLFFGVKTRAELLYDNDENSDLGDFKHKTGFQSYYSLSREQYDEAGNKIYIQDLLLNQSEQVWDIISNNNYSIYICGLKGMEAGIKSSLKRIFEKNQTDWDATYLQLKKDGRWNKEVY